MTLDKCISISLVWVESYCSNHGYKKTLMKVSDWGYTVIGGGALWKHVQSLRWVSNIFLKAHFEMRNYDNSPKSLTISKQPFDWALETSKALFSYRGTICQSTWLFLCQWDVFWRKKIHIFEVLWNWGFAELPWLIPSLWTHNKSQSGRVCVALLEVSAWVSSVVISMFFDSQAHIFTGFNFLLGANWLLLEHEYLYH